MYTRILVPLDGSEVAEQVLPYVGILAKGLDARVELLGVFAPVSPSLADLQLGLDLGRMLAGVRRQVQDYLDRVATRLRSGGIRVSSTVHEGPAAASIAHETEVEPGTLLVLCTHGWSGVTIRALGSTADRVLYASSQPVFVVPSRLLDLCTATVALKVLLVPLDGTRAAEEVLSHIVPLARALRCAVMLVRVVPMAEAAGVEAAAGGITPEGLMEGGDAEARDYLEVIRAELIRQGVRDVEVRVLRGPPSDRIMQMAAEIPDCFVAVTTHGSTWTGGGIRGSVADRLVRHGVTPVLVVPARREAPRRMSFAVLQESDASV